MFNGLQTTFWKTRNVVTTALKILNLLCQSKHCKNVHCKNVVDKCCDNDTPWKLKLLTGLLYKALFTVVSVVNALL